MNEWMITSPWLSKWVDLAHRWSMCILQEHRVYLKIEGCYIYVYFNRYFGTSLVVQWLTLWAPKTGSLGLIPCQGDRAHMPQLKISHVVMKNEDPTCHSWDLLLLGHSVPSNSLPPQGLQHRRLLCPSPSPRACSNSCPLSWWCHPTILSSVTPFSSCLQSFQHRGLF